MKIESSNTIVNKALIPIVFGITGHRDILPEHMVKLSNKLQEIFIQYKNKYPHSSFALLSPLAEGADRLAAKVALFSGISLIVPLPLPIDEYKKDFQTEDSKLEFDKLISKAVSVYVLPVNEDSTIHLISKSAVKRDINYLQTGIFVARQSQILIALWDGWESDKTGGTAHVIKLKREGLPPVYPDSVSILNQLQTGPIYHIMTPRSKRIPKGEPFTKKIYYPEYWGDEKKAKNVEETLLKSINNYNKDVKEHISSILNQIKIESKEYDKINISSEQRNDFDKIINIQLVTSSLATNYQKKRFRALKILLILVVTAFLFFQIYVEFWHKSYILMIYPFLIAIGALWFGYVKKYSYELKHEDYRALSEALRVQFFLSISNVHRCVSEYYLQKYKGELEWILYALRTILMSEIAVIGSPSDLSPETYLNGCETTRISWIKGQHSWFTSKSHKNEQKFEKLEKIANQFFFAALATVIILIFLHIFPSEWIRSLADEEKLPHKFLVVCTHMCLVISAALHGYIEKMVFGDQAKQYHRMAQLFALADKKIKRSIHEKEVNESKSIIFELAKETLAENADWLLLHRSRPLELPKG